jgi:hypothetical protein
VPASQGLWCWNARKLLDLSAYDPGYFHDFDVSADVQRFL